MNPTYETRPPQGSRAISGREWIVAAGSALILVSACWNSGGYDWIHQVTTATAALALLVISVWPRRISEGDHEGGFSRLARFPVFWLGLVIFLYILIQHLNPSLVYHHTPREWWLEPREHVAWLPSGVSVPVSTPGPLRTLVSWIPAWALVCTLWTGVTHRRTAVAIFWILSANGFLFSAFGIIQRASGGALMTRLAQIDSDAFFSSFFYKNHAAAYLIICCLVSGGLVMRSALKRARRAWLDGPGVLHLLFFITSATALVATTSVSGIVLFAAALLVLVPPSVLVVREHLRGVGTKPKVLFVIGAMALCAIGTAGFGIARDFGTRVSERINGGAAGSANARLEASRLAIQMFEDRWLFGWGAGSFQYGFPKYQVRSAAVNQVGGRRNHWEHLHNDWLELLVEFGILGALLVVMGLSYWIYLAFSHRLHRHAAWCWPAGAVLCCGFYSLGDFPLQNPAILLTLSVICPLVIRLISLEQATVSRSASAEGPANALPF